jgi:hypothetical protein
VAVGGGAYAGATLPANSVGPKQLKKHSVTPSKVAPKTIKLFKAHAGAPGKSGTARAYAYVKHGVSPTFDAARTR